MPKRNYTFFRTLSILLLLLPQTLPLLGQLVYSENTPHDFATLKENTHQISSTTDGNWSIITTKFHFSNTNRPVIIFDRRENKAYELILHKNKWNKMFNASTITSMTLIQNHLFVVTNLALFEIKINQNALSAEIVFFVKNTDNFQHSYKLGDQIFLSVFYNFHPQDAKHRHIWALYDSNDKRIKQRTIQQERDVEFSHFVNKWFDTADETIYHAQTTRYFVGIYNKQFQLIDSISSNEWLENEEKLKKINLSNLHSKDQIMKLDPFDQKELNRIIKIYALDNHNLIVLVRTKDSPTHLRMDHWRKKVNTWEKCTENVYAKWYEDGKSYTEEEVKTVTDFFQNVNDLHYLGNNTFELWYYPFLPLLNTPSFNIQKDYYDLRNQKILDKSTTFGKKNIIFNPSCNSM